LVIPFWSAKEIRIKMLNGLKYLFIKVCLNNENLLGKIAGKINRIIIKLVLLN